MKSRRLHVGYGFAVLTVLGGALCSAPARAQGPEDGPPPGQGPQGGPPGGQGGPGRPGGPGQGMRPMNQPMNVLHIPIEVLNTELKLTGTQKDKISQLQRQFMQQARPNPPGQPPQYAQAGGLPNPEMMRARMDKIRSLDQSMTRQIEDLLTASQKQALPALYKTMDALRVARIPMEVVNELHLTAEQKQQFVALTNRADAQNPPQSQPGEPPRRNGQFGDPRNGGGQPGQLHEKAMAILTAEQRRTVQDFMQKHPRPQGGPGFGPPGGPGGQGGPDMPPPPGGPGGEDGQGGPPPPPPGEPESR